MATRRGVGRVGDFALEDDPFGTKARVRLGDRGHQRLGIRMLRRGEQLFGRRGLHDPADVHHRDPRADVLDDAQVVRDEEIGEPESFLKLEQEVQDLRLDRHIQRRDGFVRDDQTGIQGKRARDADALTLAAREGMRVAPHVFRPQAHEAKELHHPVGSFLGIAFAVDEQGLADDVQEGHARVQRRERVLEDHLHLPPKGPQPALRNRCHVQDFTVVRKENLTGRRRDGAQDAAGSRGLAAAALADERQRLSPLEKEGHVVHRLHVADGLLENPPPYGEILLQPSHVEEHGPVRADGAARHVRPPLIIGRESSLPAFPRRPAGEAVPRGRSGRQWRRRNGDGRDSPADG